MTRTLRCLAACIILLSQSKSEEPSKLAISSDPNFFPIAVWLQNPNRAEQYKAAGINTYAGLWGGPTEQQLQTLQKAGMRVICSQREIALDPRWDKTVIAWMHGDEPDNAQSLGKGKGYGPPILPETIVQNYQKMHARDPRRPVLLNLGQGVAWDDYIGRGTRRRHPEDYPEYIKGCDIASFDIYPVVHDNKAVAGKLEFVAKGVERLRKWAPPEKAVWNCLECTHISNPNIKATPSQVRTEAWMSLIHGSRGLIYFVHQFNPIFREAALLDDPEMVAAVTKLNAQIRSLAPILNSPDIMDKISTTNGQVHFMMKESPEASYLFAVEMTNQPARTDFVFMSPFAESTVEVLEEGRTIVLTGNTFSDDFRPYEVHLYKISAKRK